MTGGARRSRFVAIGSVLAAIIIGTFGGFGAKTVAQVVADNAIENARAERERAAQQARDEAANELLAVTAQKARAVSLINPTICESSDSDGETCPSGIALVPFEKPPAPTLPSTRTDSDLVAYAQELETYVRGVSRDVAQLNRLCETEAELVCSVSTTTTTTTTIPRTRAESSSSNGWPVSSAVCEAVITSRAAARLFRGTFDEFVYLEAAALYMPESWAATRNMILADLYDGGSLFNAHALVDNFVRAKC